MLVNIGPRKQPEDVVDLLIECHARIRSFTELARRLGSAQGASADEVRDAAGRIRRYFTEALPRHVADEAESILPRLRGKSPALDAALARMDEEHVEHGPPLGELLHLCSTLERDPGGLAQIAPELLRVASGLEAQFQAHLTNEEEIVFPAIRSLLPPNEREAILEELRARRRPGSTQ